MCLKQDYVFFTLSHQCFCVCCLGKNEHMMKIWCTFLVSSGCVCTVCSYWKVFEQEISALLKIKCPWHTMTRIESRILQFSMDHKNVAIAHYIFRLSGNFTESDVHEVWFVMENWPSCSLIWLEGCASNQNRFYFLSALTPFFFWTGFTWGIFTRYTCDLGQVEGIYLWPIYIHKAIFT